MKDRLYIKTMRTDSFNEDIKTLEKDEIIIHTWITNGQYRHNEPVEHINILIRILTDDNEEDKNEEDNDENYI